MYILKYKNILFLLILVNSLNAAFEPKGVGTNYVAVGSAGRAGSDNSFSVFLNPAKIGNDTSTRINLFYRNYYGIKNLDQIDLEFQFMAFNIPLGIGVGHYGISTYNETEIRLAGAYRLLKAIDLGFSMNLYHVALKNYGQDYTAGFTLAAMYEIVNNIKAAFVVDNLNEPELGSAKEKIPVTMALAFAYQPADDFQVVIDLLKEPDYGFDFRAGFIYHFRRWFALRSGFKTIVKTFGAGFSMDFNRFELGYAFEYNLDLGGSHSISVGYEF